MLLRRDILDCLLGDIADPEKRRILIDLSESLERVEKIGLVNQESVLDIFTIYWPACSLYAIFVTTCGLMASPEEKSNILFPLCNIFISLPRTIARVATRRKMRGDQKTKIE